MKKVFKLALAAATPALLLAGCTDFLKGPGLNSSPNQPTTATPDQLWVGSQVALMAQWENWQFMLFTCWANGLSGQGRQWAIYANYKSGTDLKTADAIWNQTYGPGGLTDLQKVVSGAGANLKYKGQAQVLIALYMGTAADIWGNVPFSNAGTPQPTFDTQASVYAQVQTLLDDAITNLGGAGSGSGSTDFFYGSSPVGIVSPFNGDFTPWIKAAHTLKARFYMHTARTGATTYDNAILAQVVSQAALGISDSTLDFRPNHTTTPGEQNLFFSFLISRAGDVGPDSVHLAETVAAGEAGLLPNWYVANKYGNYYGAPSGYLPTTATLTTDSFATFAVANKAKTSWPIVSYAENAMLSAEANFRAGTGTPGAELDAYRATLGIPALGLTTGTALLNAILREKYIHQFFNPEIWQDYLRTCYPNFPLPLNSGAGLPYVPARFAIGYTEQNSNPNAFVAPNPGTQPAGNPGNKNMFVNATTTDGATTCFAQVQRPVYAW